MYTKVLTSYIYVGEEEGGGEVASVTASIPMCPRCAVEGKCAGCNASISLCMKLFLAFLLLAARFFFCVAACEMLA